MKKTYTVLASLMLLAACNGEEDTEEVEEVEDTEGTEEVEEDTEDDTEDEAAEEDTEDEAAETEEESTDDEANSENDENQYAGNSYLLSIQHGGQLQPFGELIFEDDTVTLEQEDTTLEGTYSVDDKTLNYEVENDDMKIIATLVQNDYEGEIVVEGNVESYEIESDDLTTEDEEALEELQGAVFTMTKND